MIPWATLFNFIRRYYWIVQAITILILFFLLRKERQKVADVQHHAQVQRQAIETWRDTAGKNRIRAEIAEVDASNARLVLEEKLRKAIQQEIGNLRRNLISYSAVKASTNGSSRTGSTDTVYVVDQSLKTVPPLSAKQFSLNNLDLQFRGLYVPLLDTLIAEYRINHNFEVFHYYRRPGKPPFNLFRRKYAVAEIKFENPNTQGDSLYTIRLERKRGWLRKFLGE